MTFNILSRLESSALISWINKFYSISFLALLYGSVSFSQITIDFTKQQQKELHPKWTIDNWDDGGELTRYTFLNMSEFWSHAIINKKGEPSSFSVNELSIIGQFKTSSNYGELALEDYIKTAPVDAMLVLHNNTIVYETYLRMQPEDKHVYMSVTKIVVSSLVAILEDRGVIDVSKPIEFYLPELKGSGWQDVTILDILDMASGIDCLESVEGAYENPENCIYQYEATLGFLRPTDATPKNTWEHIKSLKSQKSAGDLYEYTSVNTFVLSELIERVTNQSLTKNIEIYIWQKMGAESDAIMAQRNGVPIAHAGLSSTLRDLARFGSLFLTNEISKGKDVMSSAYLKKIQFDGRPAIYSNNWLPETRLQHDGPKYSPYQWDMVMQDGDFFKEGFGGQGLYISPSRN